MSHREKQLKKSAVRVVESDLGVIDLPYLLLTLLLVAIGLLVLFSASYARAYYETKNAASVFVNQLIFAVMGIGVMWLISRVPYEWYQKLSLLILAASIGLLVLVPVIGTESGGATRWLDFGFVSFQPSEIAKFALILMFAHLIALYGERMKTFRYGFLPFFGILGLICVLVIAEKHVSATIIICLIAFIMMFVGGTKFRYFAVIGGAAAAAIGALVLFSSKFAYAMDRVHGWLDPFNPPEGVDTWQTVQSLYAIGSGQLLGVGIGQSRQKYLYIPEPQNDFVFAVVCEELGFIGALIVIILFALFIWRGVYIALHARDRFGTMLALGITFQFGVQAILNICVVTNTIPNTGISLPFFSFGGTALIMLLAEMGVLLSVSRHSNTEKM